MIVNRQKLLAPVLATVVIISGAFDSEPTSEAARVGTKAGTIVDTMGTRLLAQMHRVLNAEQSAFARQEAVDQAEQALIDWMRNISGARERLGAQADDVFRNVDEARTAAFQRLIPRDPPPARARPLGSSALMLRTSLPSFAASRRGAQGKVIAHALGLLAGTPSLYADFPRDEQGNRELPPERYDPPSEKNVQTHAQIHVKLVGSQIEATIEITFTAEKEGVVYREEAAGSSRIDVCPDASGEVHVKLTLHGRIGVGDANTQFQFQAQGTGHVDDDANLVTYDVETQAEMGRQPSSDGRSRGESDQYLEWNERYTMRALDGTGSPMSGASRKVTRQSSNVDQTFIGMSTDLISRASWMAVGLALTTAEIKWRDDSYCVEVSVPEMGSDLRKTVPPNSVTPFAAVVRHKFERKELVAGVIAKLTSGALSVSPAGSKVPAPATFRYKAPGKGGESGNVGLESRSRRGVGKLGLTFVPTQGFRVYQSIPYGTISGPICVLDKPFALQLKVDLNGAHWTGSYSFTPSDERGGTWDFDGAVRVDDTTGRIKGTGNYKLEGTTERASAIKMDATQFTVTFPEFGGGSSPVGALSLALEPADDGCPQPSVAYLIQLEKKEPAAGTINTFNLRSFAEPPRSTSLVASGNPNSRH